VSGLRPYQSDHANALLEILKSRGVAHDGSDCGTGKSYTGAWIAKKTGLETLVICPLSVVVTWRSILADFGVTATVINYESAHRRLGKLKPYGTGSFFAFDRVWPLTIYDECHRVSGETTINSKMMIASKRAGGRILTLSATAADSVLKLKALGFALGLHALQDYKLWLIRHGAEAKPIYGRGGKQVLQKNGQPATKIEIGKRANTAAMGEIHNQIFGTGRRGSRMRIVDIPDFPQTQIEVRLLDGCSKEVTRLSEELQQFYAQRNVLAQFTEDELAKLVFWRQAAEVAKIPHFIEMTEDALESSKVALFSNYNRTVDELVADCEKRGWSCGVIRGEQKTSDRQDVITRFQANRIDVVVANIQAGGVGVSLHDPVTKFPRTAIISPCWDAVGLKQAVGRVHRSGGGTSMQYLAYWSTGIEARVASSVKRKISNLDLLNDGEISGFGEAPLVSKSSIETLL